MSVRKDFQEFIDERGIKSLGEMEQDGIYSVHISIDGENGKYLGQAIIYEEEEMILFNVSLGLKVPADKRAKLAEYMLDMNYDYRFAGLYIEPDTDLILGRAGLRVRGERDERMATIKAAIVHAATIVDENYKEIARLVIE